jgi:hypothetical protein
MNIVDRTGTFRGNIVDTGVSETKNGFPQFVGRFKATEFYDEAAQAWVPWAEYEQEIIGYLVLYTKDKKVEGKWVELMNAAQLKKALGWDGTSFETLQNTDWSQKLVMFRVDNDDYNGNISLKVNWVDAADANPTRQLQKYDTAKLKALDQQFAGILGTKAPVAASAPAAAPTGAVVPPKRGPGRPKSSPAAAPTAAPAPAPATAPPTAPTAPSSPPPAAAQAVSKPCTKTEAWEAVYAYPARKAEVTDEKLGQLWLDEVAKIGKTEDTMTPEDWGKVRDATVTAASMF